MNSERKQQRQLIQQQIRQSKRVMFVASLTAATSSLAWVLVTLTVYWSRTATTHSGLWRSCGSSGCNYHTFFPSREDKRSMDEHVLDYRRTSVVFAGMSFVLMVMSLLSALYTFKNARYVYKRLAAALFFSTAGCMLIVMESVVTLVRYEETKNDTTAYFGPCFYTGWAIFLVHLVTGCLFLLYSRKIKGHFDDSFIN